jgi:hypothetical protein
MTSMSEISIGITRGWYRIDGSPDPEKVQNYYPFAFLSDPDCYFTRKSIAAIFYVYFTAGMYYQLYSIYEILVCSLD